MKSTKNKYQVVIVLSPVMKEKDRVVLLDKLKARIEKEGVKVKKMENQGLKSLAYEINGYDKGDFWLFDVRGRDGLKLDELNVFLNREAGIIRYLVLKV